MGVFDTRKSDFIGRRFGKLVGLYWVRRDKWGKSIWMYRCECGTVREYLRSNLLNNRTQCCGCYRKPRKHGDTVGRKQTVEYKAWYHMKGRCYTPTDHKYKDYGGRGIRVCARWLYSYKNFLADMGRKPGPEYSLDRIDVNGHYEPSNCRWATAKEQANNKRCHVKYKKLGGALFKSGATSVPSPKQTSMCGLEIPTDRITQ